MPIGFFVAVEYLRGAAVAALARCLLVAPSGHCPGGGVNQFCAAELHAVFYAQFLIDGLLHAGFEVVEVDVVYHAVVGVQRHACAALVGKSVSAGGHVEAAGIFARHAVAVVIARSGRGAAVGVGIRTPVEVIPGIVARRVRIAVAVVGFA